MENDQRYAAARRFYTKLPALEVDQGVGQPGNLLDRAMCLHYGVGERCNSEEPYRSGSLANARSWRTRPRRMGGPAGTLYPTGQQALEAVGEDAFLYDMFVANVVGY